MDKQNMKIQIANKISSLVPSKDIGVECHGKSFIEFCEECKEKLLFNQGVSAMKIGLYRWANEN